MLNEAVKNFLERVRRNKGTAFRYLQDNKIESVSYEDFVRKCYDEQKEVEKNGIRSVAFIRALSLETLVGIFGCLLNNDRVALIAHMAPLSSILEMQKKADTIAVNIEDPMFSPSEKKKIFAQMGQKRKYPTDGHGTLVFFKSDTRERFLPLEYEMKDFLPQKEIPYLDNLVSTADEIYYIEGYEEVSCFLCNIVTPLFKGITVDIGRGSFYIENDLKVLQPTMIFALPQMVSFLAKRNAFSQGIKKLAICGVVSDRVSLSYLVQTGVKVYSFFGPPEVCSIALCSSGTGQSELFWPAAFVDVREDNGLLCYRSPFHFSWYFGFPERKREVVDEEGFYHSHTRGKVQPNGSVFFYGRTDGFVRFPDGVEINLKDLEDILKGMIPGLNCALTIYKGSLALTYYSSRLNHEVIEEAVKKINALTFAKARIRYLREASINLPRDALGNIKRGEINELPLTNEYEVKGERND